MDASYSSDYSWQLSQDHTVGYSSGEMDLRLRVVRLPRPRSVVPPDITTQLEAEWDSTDLFVIAEEEGPIGYLSAYVQGHDAWIHRIVVDKPYRRDGVGTTLLHSAHEWAKESGLQGTLTAVPTRNHPAIAFFRSNGYTICGYSERHFPSGDIALYLAHDIATARSARE